MTNSYTLSVLQSKILEDSAILGEVPSYLTCHSKIPFTCHCGILSDNFTFFRIKQLGALCRGCMQNRRHEKIGKANASVKTASDLKAKLIAIQNFVDQYHPSKGYRIQADGWSGLSKDPVTTICKEHGPWKAYVANLRKGCGCLGCKGALISQSKLRPDEFFEKQEKKFGNRFTASNYKGMAFEFSTFCNTCNTPFTLREARHHLESDWGGCPVCRIRFCRHKTENILADLLNAAGLRFDREVTLVSVKNKNDLRYDFRVYLPKNIVVLIELDGAQHFTPIAYWKSTPAEIQKRDIYKMKAAEEQGYTVIRMSQVDIWENKNDPSWFQEHILKDILSNDCSSHMFYSSKSDLYDEHIRLYEIVTAMAKS